MKTETSYLEEFIKKDPLKTPSFIRAECLKNHYNFSMTKINNTLAKIRKEIFPSGRKLFSHGNFIAHETNQNPISFSLE